MLKLITVSILLASSAIAADRASVVVVGQGGETRAIGVAELEQMSPGDITVTDTHTKQAIRYRGVPLISILALVGTPVGEALRGKAMTLHVRAEASDAYAVSFSLAELDAGFGGTEALVVFQQDGQSLKGDTGPFRLVVPTDKRGGRWVRGLVKISVLD